MPTDDNLTEDQFARVQTGVQMLIEHLLKVEGLPLPGVLAAAHAEIMNAIASVYGGDMAADCARLAADRVAGMPSFEDFAEANPLATMAMRGRA